jgi:uncharacterized damage-inducible protein DinB
MAINKEVQYIITTLRNTLEGEPWYGRAVFNILGEVDPAIAYKKPGNGAHSLIDILYHMLTWAQFAQTRLLKEDMDIEVFEQMDWREIDPNVHTWEKGVEQLKKTHQHIIHLLEDKNDEFLKEKVDYREYNYRFMLHGLIQHNIYHLGQIAYIKQLL